MDRLLLKVDIHVCYNVEIPSRERAVLMGDDPAFFGDSHVFGGGVHLWTPYETRREAGGMS